jgi:hypothetical protein
MEATLVHLRDAGDLPAPKQAFRCAAAALSWLMEAVERLVEQRRDVPPEFFRYPLP